MSGSEEESSTYDENEIKDFDGKEDNEGGGVLNEEQRSLIIEEILRANDDEFVLEDECPSPDKRLNTD